MESVCSTCVGERHFAVDIGSQRVELPVVSLSDNLALALLITVDMGVNFMTSAGRELADIIRPYDVDIVATVATMGIPLVIEVTRALELDQYVILHKTPKIHLADAVAEPVRSITTDADQRLLFDRARIDDVDGRRPSALASGGRGDRVDWHLGHRGVAVAR